MIKMQRLQYLKQRVVSVDALISLDMLELVFKITDSLVCVWTNRAASRVILICYVYSIKKGCIQL